MNQMLQSCSDAGAGERLFMSQELSDVTISVCNGDKTPWKFPVHSLVLASQSIVFRRMLEDEFSEKKTGLITIKDFKPKVVQLLLEYVYRGKVSLENWLDGLELLRAAHKYQIHPLFQHCARFLEAVLSLTNVCHIFKEASLYTLAPLKEKCTKLILDAGFAILRSKAFEVLHKEDVMDVITSSSLNIDSELVVFEALLRWAPMQCCRTGIPVTEANILQELMPFLKFMCFDDMSDTEKSALPSAVLSCVKPNNRNRVAYYVPDSLLQYSQTFRFEGDLETLEFIGNSITCVRFSVDSPQYVVGFKLMVVLAEFPCSFPLILNRECGGTSSPVSSANLGSATFTLGVEVNDLTDYDATVVLKQPCYLEAKTVYELSLVDRTQSSCCPQTKLRNGTLMMEKGSVSVSIHSESVWGVTGIIIM